MANFNGFVLTNKGRELLAKAVAGEQLTFTKMEVGDGAFTGDVKTLTALVNKKDDFNINQIENQENGQVLLKAIISNKNITTGYNIKEIGIFAHGDDNVEILYAYNKAIETDYFPAFNSSNVVEIEYQNYIIIDQAQNVTALIDPSLTYITKEEVESKYVKNTQIATSENAGIISEERIQELIRGTEAAYVLGAKYGGVFGSELTSVEANKVYYYYDSTKDMTIPYLALNNKTGTFITPDTLNFQSLANRDNLFYKKLTITSSAVNGINLSLAFTYGNLLIINGFITGSAFLNGLSIGTEIVNLKTMISELSNGYGVYASTISGSNLDIKENFTLAKPTALNFTDGEHFVIITGLTKGIIK